MWTFFVLKCKTLSTTGSPVPTMVVEPKVLPKIIRPIWHEEKTSMPKTEDDNYVDRQRSSFLVCHFIYLGSFIVWGDTHIQWICDLYHSCDNPPFCRLLQDTLSSAVRARLSVNPKSLADLRQKTELCSTHGCGKTSIILGAWCSFHLE